MSEEISKEGYKPRERSPAEALSKLMELCSRSERSSGDAMRLMSRWGVAKQEREGVLERLVELRFIDDRRYADAYVREKARLNGWGRYKIGQMLSNKGVSRSVIEQALKQLSEVDTNERLREMIERRVGRIKAKSDHELKGKLLRYGLGLGYSYEEVVGVVEKIVSTDR